MIEAATKRTHMAVAQKVVKKEPQREKMAEMPTKMLIAAAASAPVYK